MLTSSIALFCAVLLPLDTAGPTVTVGNLPNQKRFDQENYVVQGKALARDGISAVWFRVNDGAWTKAAGTSAWRADVAWSPGTNLFQVFSQDAAGNNSRTSNVSCFLSRPAQLNLSTDGAGKILPIGFRPESVEIGRVYTVKAIPGPGMLFSGWNGHSDTRNNPLTFVMQSNLVLTADFIPSPFSTLQGEYNGLFYPSDDATDFTPATTATNSGFISIRITSNGAFSGKLILDGVGRGVTGKFDANLSANFSVKMPGNIVLNVSLQFDDSTGVMMGTVQESTHWTSALLAYRAATEKPSLFSGTYTLLVEGCDKNGQCFQYAKVPYGDGPGAVKVTPSGAVQMTGTLADGAFMSHRINVSSAGWWPLYVAPYHGKGLLLGWLNFSPDTGGLSSVMWEKPPGVAGEKYYTDGFSSLRVARLAACSAPASNSIPTFPTNCLVKINSGNLPGPLTNHVALTNSQPVVLGGDIRSLNLSVTFENGQFKGYFIHPVTQKPTVVRGAINQDAPTEAPWFGNGGGWFLGPSGESGNIRFLPQ